MIQVAERRVEIMHGRITFIVGPPKTVPETMDKTRVQAQSSGCCIRKFPFEVQ